ncbi:MAG: hypothetical protein E6J91_42335 [Deltaproteobacteria bacterium]|nr:MAG: hypothetical protein E6J91_42335 [Deltaproteobacteria bacterium]
MTDRTALRARIVGCVEIVHSQAAHMGNSVVPLAVLKNEIGFFEGLHTRLAPIVLFAERARGITWDGDTQEMTSNDDETAR